MARTRTLKVTLTFADDASAGDIDAAILSIVEDLNAVVKRDFTKAGAATWLPHEGTPSNDFAFAEEAHVEHAVTLSERLDKAPALIHFGTPVPA